MADISPEDLSREIGRLWARVGSLPPDPSSPFHVPATEPAASSMGADAAWETVGLLKKQTRQREDAWQRTIEARDEALRVLRARLESAETELSRLRERAEGEDERSLVTTMEAQQRIETAQKALALAEARHAEERRALADAMQSLRERIAAETARGRSVEQRWQEREQQYLLDIKELQGLVERRERDASSAEKEVRARDAGLAEAKNALEKTLSELLVERQERERAHKERDAAVKKVDELRAHIDELSKIWDEERAQWKELWDRERSTWETQRAELAHWEENLRREREAWHAELQVKEKAHLELTEDLSGKIRETSKTAEKMSSLISDFDRKSAEDAARVSQGTVLAAARARERAEKLRRGALALAAALIVAAASRPAWRAGTAWKFVPESSAAAPTNNPSALAFDGRSLLIADWGGRLLEVDPADPGRVRLQADPQPSGSYHPSGIAAGGGSIWTSDAAQARLLRHSAAAPEKIVASRPSPGPAPAALAFDGETVWSYDAVNRSLTRHGGDDGTTATYDMPDEAVPNAMAWADGRLWVHDAKSRRLLVYELRKGKLELIEAQSDPAEGIIGLAAAGNPSERKIFVLVGPSGSRVRAEIIRYRVRRLLPFAHF